MKINILTVFFAFLLTAGSIFGQTSWLDRPLNNWNPTTGVVPTAPRATGEAPTSARCRDQIRSPESLSDRALTRAGWTLFGAAQTFGAVTLINGTAGVDGQCRPMQYNTFIFVSNRFAGTLSPTVMDSRTDGALSQARLNNPTSITADFSRYTSSDALCCPSQTSTVVYTIQNGRVTANDVNTQAACQNQNEPDTPAANAVTGRINYNPRGGRQRNATIIVRLVDVTRTNPTVIAEEQIEVTNNQQFPIPYELRYEPNRIDQRNRYAVQAEMNTQNRTIARTETNSPVLTQGNPTNVDLTLIQTGGGGNQQNNSILRGTVAYRERIALPNNASVTVQLLDSSIPDANAAVIAETTFSSGNRQVPIPFELGYNRNQIDLNRRYSLRAEISVEGQVRWTTDTNVPVLTQGSPTDNVQLILVQGRQTPAPVTGQTLNLSKFGTGSIQIATQGSTFLVRGSVNVKADGNADVTVAGITGGITFSGKLTFFDQTTMRITVESSGNADAGGEIEIRYNGRRLESITGNNLTLDGQNVTLRF
jgi:uncharacterized lipoprotein YbaY